MKPTDPDRDMRIAESVLEEIAHPAAIPVGSPGSVMRRAWDLGRALDHITQWLVTTEACRVCERRQGLGHARDCRVRELLNAVDSGSRGRLLSKTPAPVDREALGRELYEQIPTGSGYVRWEGVEEEQREKCRRIGERLYRMGEEAAGARCHEVLVAMKSERDAATARAEKAEREREELREERDARTAKPAGDPKCQRCGLPARWWCNAHQWQSCDACRCLASAAYYEPCEPKPLGGDPPEDEIAKLRAALPDADYLRRLVAAALGDA